MKNTLANELKANISRSESEIRTLQDRRFRELLSFVWKHSSFYRSIYQSHGIVPSDFQSIAYHELPVIDRSMILSSPNFFSDLVTNSNLNLDEINIWPDNKSPEFQLYNNKFLVVRSSGTGVAKGALPGVHVYDSESLELIHAAILTRICPELDCEDKINLTFIGKLGCDTAGEVLTRAAPEAHFNVNLISSFEHINQIAKQVEATNPHILGGYPGILVQLANLCNKGKLNIKPLHINSSGEPLTTNMLDQIKQAWGHATLHDIYACMESLAGIGVKKLGEKSFTTFDDLHIIEVLDDFGQPVNPGETGELVMTNLYNKAYPLLRYKLGDLVTRSPEGKIFRQISRVLGRKYHYLELPGNTPSGISTVPAQYINNYKIAGVDTIQFILKSPEHLQVWYTGRTALQPNIQKTIQHDLIQKYDISPSLEIEVVKSENVYICPYSGKANKLVILI